MRRLPVDQIEEIEAETGVGQLNKSLGLWQLTAIGVGGIIGVGIFPSLGWWLMATRTTPAWAPPC
jgi:APA family basic amino acid/polyamine antiporter